MTKKKQQQKRRKTRSQRGGEGDCLVSINGELKMGTKINSSSMNPSCEVEGKKYHMNMRGVYE
jgi:hypothetical protein